MKCIPLLCSWKYFISICGLNGKNLVIQSQYPRAASWLGWFYFLSAWLGDCWVTIPSSQEGSACLARAPGDSVHPGTQVGNEMQKKAKLCLLPENVYMNERMVKRSTLVLRVGRIGVGRKAFWVWVGTCAPPDRAGLQSICQEQGVILAWGFAAWVSLIRKQCFLWLWVYSVWAKGVGRSWHTFRICCASRCARLLPHARHRHRLYLLCPRHCRVCEEKVGRGRSLGK